MNPTTQARLKEIRELIDEPPTRSLMCELTQKNRRNAALKYLLAMVERQERAIEYAKIELHEADYEWADKANAEIDRILNTDSRTEKEGKKE